ncbi:hypothetical protein [Nocardia sp. NPDC004260]
MSITKAPEPALIRSAGMVITAIVAYVLGRDVSTQWVEMATTVYALIVAPMVAAYLTRRVVSPTPEYIGKHRPEAIE